jgi:cytochrome bd ubiquinol oxidase subunit II
MTASITAYILAIIFILGLSIYAILDGFDLGIGNSFFIFKKEERGRLMDIIAPFWDGNETWIVFAATLGIAAFPLTYFVMLPSLYIPAIIMVVGLFMRGISFEFRLKAQGRDKLIWDTTFFIGSFIASFFQGVLFSSAFVGLEISNDDVYTGGALDFINPFSIVSGFLTCLIYLSLGLGFVRYKMTGNMANKAAKIIKKIIPVSFVSTFIMEFWLINSKDGLKDHFFSESYKLNTYLILSLVSFAVLVYLFRLLNKSEHNVKTFLTIVVLFSISLIKKIVIFWPFFIFPQYTILQAANPSPALKFTFIIVCIFLPIVIFATIFAYSTFRGKLLKSDQFYS